jgi:hypothetical protein
MVMAMAFTSQSGLTASGGALVGGVCLLGFGVGRGMSEASLSTLAFVFEVVSPLSGSEPSKMEIAEDFEWRSG